MKEATYKEDMYNASFVLLGLNDKNNDLFELNELFKKYIYNHNNNINIIYKSYEEAELFKYTLNCFLAVKVWYFNEIYEICDKYNVKYNDLKDLFKLDNRIGESHIDVPGIHGRGFSGKCLPKELKGLKELQKELNIPNDVISNILSRNDHFLNNL